MSCELIIDTREKHVSIHTDALKDIPHRISQITTGDYVIITPTNRIMMVIERKTLNDYAASIKDGRHNNKQKLIELRHTEKCAIVYLIEGPAFPRPDQLFGRIPYKNIQSSMFHLMVRDNITVLQTKNSLHTAEILAAMVASMNTLIANHKTEWHENETNVHEIAGSSEVVAFEQTAAILTAPHHKTLHHLAQEAWCVFRGIGIEIADAYIDKWCIADIICGKINRNDIMTAKHKNGKLISKGAMASLTGITRQNELRIMATCPGISKITAGQLSSRKTLAQYLEAGENAFAAEVIVGESNKSRTIGPASARKLWEILYYCGTSAETPSTITADDTATLGATSKEVKPTRRRKKTSILKDTQSEN